MKVTIVGDNNQIINLEIDENEPVSTLQELIGIELNIPVEQQQLYFTGKVLDSKQIIKDAGIKDQDMIQVSKKMSFGNFNFNPQQQQQQQGGNQGLQQALSNVLQSFGGNVQQGNQQQQQNNPFGNMFNTDPMNNPLLVNQANQIRQQLQNNPDQLNHLLHQNRELAEAVVSDNPRELIEYLHKKNQQEQQEKLRRQQRLIQLQSDPFNPEYQKEIEKMMQEENVSKQRELAMEEHPEFFGQICMLYIEININGNPIQAFVDSGAQSTIMSKGCAERCGLMRLLDTRFAGTAVGVGSAKILGRIHIAQMDILDKKLPVNLTILDNDSIDFLLGLDTLKRYQCIMDLGDRQLTFRINNEKVTVPFLSDGEIKKSVSIEREKALMEEENKMQTEQKPQSFPEEKIKTLTDIGATREEAIQALQQCMGNVEFAAGIISQKKFG